MKPPDLKGHMMEDQTTVAPLYPGIFPPPDADDSDAPYPKAPLNLTLGFDLETFQIPLEELMPSKKRCRTG
ncbi:hypothetical protein ACFOHS_18865 [Jhaorihella thermophila]